MNRQLYIVDGKPHRFCDCSPRAGVCQRGGERQLHTTELSRCLVPSEDVVLASPALGYVLVEIATINELCERIKGLIAAGSADARSIADVATLLLVATLPRG